MHVNGKVHGDEKFADPAMDDMEDRLSKLHKDVMAQLIGKIEAELDKEYS